MDALENQIRQLLDREEIRAVLVSHARTLDRHDLDGLAEAYHEGALENHGAFQGDARVLASRTGEEHAAFCTAHLHYVSNHTIDLEGDLAHAETYFLAGLLRKDGLTEMVGGRYIDRFERREGRWAIVERGCIVEWNGELQPTRTPFDKASFLQGQWNRDDLSYCRPLGLRRESTETERPIAGQ